MLALRDLVSGIPSFGTRSHADKIRIFCWYVQSITKIDRFGPTDVQACYDELRMAAPKNIGPFLAHMLKTKPPELLKDARGHYLEHTFEERMNTKYGYRNITIQVTKMLMELPSKVPDVAEREFLDEALICYRNGAFRAAIVMVWNLTFDHLLNFIHKHHLAAFNRQWPISFAKQNQKARVQIIVSRDDFGEIKESEILSICKAATIITPGQYDILDEKLGKRNTAAHPSAVVISQISVEGVIDDLVNNVVLKLAV